jgi:tetratricopeptide (TPR) repeat protein
MPMPPPTNSTAIATSVIVLAKVDADLRKSDANVLDQTEKDISRSFELESRSPHAAVTWLHERALKGLLKGGEDLAFEESIGRAKEVGVAEKNVAFAMVASFLFQGDTAGAAAMIAKWDQQAQDDPWFHLLAGATFERAGDARAVERYSAAVKLDPDLFIAQVLLLRAMAVDGDPHRAAEEAKAFRAKFPDRVEPMALVALAWARDPMRGDEPAEVKAVTDKADALPNPLRAVGHAAKGIVALEKRSIDEAKPALQKALSLAETPGVAAWIGSIALATGDEALARKAALAAVSFSAVYGPARVLAARVALLGARLDEALKAVEDLPPSSPDVAVVTAAVAYEKLDAERMARAFDAIDASSKSLPFVHPLARGQALLAGTTKEFGAADKVLDMADDEGPWADLVAMDYALDTGDLELAAKIAAQWTGDVRSPRAVRLARLARYTGKNDDADRLSKAAIEGGTVTIRALVERVFTLVAINKAGDALALFKTYPNVGGPLAKWLRAYAVASSGKIEEAKSAVSSEDPPPLLAPLPARMLAASAYGAMKDTRHGNEYTRPIVQAGFANPDMATAAEKVGIGKIARRR